jgi:hypothetical protein
MDPALTVVYLVEVRSECRLALQAEKDLLAAVANRKIIVLQDEDNLTDEERRHFEELNEGFSRAHINTQAMLAHAAAVSRLLSPGNGKWRRQRDERAAELRELVGVSQADLDALARSLRNDLEHFDERLYEWAELPSTDLYYLHPARALMYALDPYKNDPRELSRSYHPGKHLFTFWGDTYDLGEISRALISVNDAAGIAGFSILDANPGLFADQDVD